MKTYQLSVKLYGMLEISAETESEAIAAAQGWSLSDVEDYSLEVYDIFCPEDYDENGFLINKENEDGNND